jgi:iron complex outermembrane receptor protein
MSAQQPVDTAAFSVKLHEVTIAVKQGINHDRQAKPTSSVEEYLQTAEKVKMIRRGNYAWEPVINNMTSERISVTVDGMKIFHACTDKMDPVTSYVETVNLSKVSVGSGFNANPNASNNIGGSLDLKLNKTGFCCDGWDVNLRSGYESNGNYQVYGADAAFSDSAFYVNMGAFYRNSGNYSAGGGEEIPFSQFRKMNFFTNFGFLVAKKHIIEGTLIYDKASDVGYPALTMDVKKAEGLISSLSYRRENLPLAGNAAWETKLYYNDITHIMDDTHRPDVAIHMDMPGKSRTGGVYSSLKGSSGWHRFVLNWDAWYNQSLAEMTMYPANPNEKPMFMYTWPDIRTANTGIFASDIYRFNEHHVVRLSSKISFQRDEIQSDFGVRTMQVYYPDRQAYNNRLLWNISGGYQLLTGGWEFDLSAGWGTRAPSSSEAYGFFLFNTFDAYDYLGNPDLKNESSAETSFSLRWKNSVFDVKAETSAFFFADYIIGKPDASLYAMTIGANGVKAYLNLPRALVWNTGLSFSYRFLDGFTWSSRSTYSTGRDGQGNNLPLIAPLTYDSSVSFRRYRFSAQAGIEGAARQVNFSPEYGEDLTKAYLTANLSAGYDFRIKKTGFNLRAGVENLFDEYYSAYSDWNNIPRKGRNFFINLNINFI